MNSKEALETLYRNCPMTVVRENDGINLYSEYLVEVIKQDLDKLEQYKQLEEELGIDLELYINTHLKGVYVKGMEPLWSGGQKYEILHYAVVGFTKECLEVRYKDSHDIHRLWYPLEDYGEIWALTLEELQND